ncbi:hypothetical protein [Thermoplasma volcanium GSS1]|uniref:Phosphoesterase n=1 Tax=Thermoplasma volcanium (strain ATCC 51530 / DSM 4299 / JCM 9571 / NBRC 15438 / GSS1) TaxID=273116 RepID=Q979E2_THEVO|nr:YfcE family phosphodiesterase [Thermoplasma volcanium]BAB60361.1 hypothetical protein [Thermoplasma volcanium GSS1]
MKVIIYSDIHANLEAMKEVIKREKFDIAIFLGDVVDYGPKPAETLDLVMENMDYGVMGNHDYAAATGEDCNCAPDMHDLSEFSRKEVTLPSLSSEDLKRLSSLKEFVDTEIDGRKILMTHASPNNHLFGYLFATEAEMVWKDKRYSSYDLIMVGHTHFQMLYRNKIINPGSAGQPRDGDWRPMYAIWDTDADEVIFKRFKYDNNTTWKQIKEIIPEGSPYLDQLRKFYF